MKTPRLKEMMGAYFHEDFFEVHGGVWETVDAYVTDDPIDASKLPNEIDWTLEQYPDEQDLRKYVRGLGCSYRVQPEDGGYRGWLTEIARRVTEATRAAGRQP